MKEIVDLNNHGIAPRDFVKKEMKPDDIVNSLRTSLQRYYPAMNKKIRNAKSRNNTQERSGPKERTKPTIELDISHLSNKLQ